MPDDLVGAQGGVEEAAAPSSVGTAQDTSQQTSPVTQTTSDTQQTAPAFSMVGWLKSKGYDTAGFQDDSSAAEALLSRAIEYEQARPLVDAGRQFQQHRTAFEQWQAEQAKQQKPPDKPWWNSPDWEESWQHQVIQDPQTGVYVSRPGVDPQVGVKVNAFMRHQADTLRRLSRDPIGTLKPGIEETILPLVEKRVQEILAKQQIDQYTSSFERDNASWLYQNNNGQLVTNPVTGQPQLSPTGMKFFQTIDQINQAGNNPMLKAQLARQLLGLGANGQPAPTPQQVNEQHKQAFLGHQPNHSGSLTPPPSNDRYQMAQNEGEEFRVTTRRLMDAAYANGTINDDPRL